MANARELADRLRQVAIDIAELRQQTVKYGVQVRDPYGELLHAEGLVLSAVGNLRRRAESEA
jgi:hypothetical protein